MQWAERRSVDSIQHQPPQLTLKLSQARPDRKEKWIIDAIKIVKQSYLQHVSIHSQFFWTENSLL